MDNNIMLDTDVYKLIHWSMIPENVNYTYAHMMSRGVTDKGVPLETQVLGFQYILKKYFEGQVVTKEKLEEAQDLVHHIYDNPERFNRAGWKHILEKHDGYLPLVIKAVPEGMTVPCHNILASIENTDPTLPWLTTFVETPLLRAWYPITVGTTSRGIKQLISKYVEKTGGDPNIEFHLNDFGARGVSSKESAGIGAMAHFANFMGGDTIEGIRYAKKYYYADRVTFGVPASEHSETLLFGQDGEQKAYEHFMDKFPTGLLSIVIDTYDTMNAVDNIIGNTLKDKILNRDGKVVIRPDSGYPPHITVQILKSLYKNFGGTINDKGYIVLNPKVGVIYGDYIRYGMIDDILEAMVKEGFSTDCIVFGMGGALLQQVNRDTFKFAIKNSAKADLNYNWEGIAKTPVTDPMKRSRKGRLQLVKHGEKFVTQEYNKHQVDLDLLVPVFKNGKMITEYNWEDVRERAAMFS